MKKLTLSVAALSIAMMSYGQSTQCKGLTKDSVQCKNRTSQVLCYLHNENYVSKSSIEATRCSGNTKKGKRCKLRTLHSSGMCHHHRD